MKMTMQSIDYPCPLDRLFARHTAITKGRGAGDSTTVHRAILDRLDANRRVAEVVPDWPAR